MAHTIEVKTPPYEVLNTDLEITIYKDSNKHGTIKISRGNIEWLPSGFGSPYTMEWSEFDELMREQGTR